MSKRIDAVLVRPQTRNDCDFCDEFVSGTSNAFHALYHDALRTRILHATERFRVFPTIGQLVEGYLMIAPVSHYTAMDQIPTDATAELTELAELTRSALSKLYGPSVFFEHGARGPINGGCGIYHAHLHAVPLNGLADPVEILKHRFSYTEASDLPEFTKQSKHLPSYLFYQDSNARLYLFDTGPLPSQYMRKLLANSLGDDNWNWRKVGREDRLLSTIERLSGRFDTMCNTVPPR
ncbi:MAG TPA: hypothetical protein VFI45_12910 [Candidatus Acidoferrum sp.]|nr:hypothetical protein [Candidatus Acidoferrum sp.]